MKKAWLAWLSLAAANTEFLLFTVPWDYDVPAVSYAFPGVEMRKEADFLLVSEFPIVDASTYAKSTLAVPNGDFYVKLNDYKGSTYQPGDFLGVKLCWPATVPFGFSLEMQYINSSHFGGTSAMDLYLFVHLKPDFYAVKPVNLSVVEVDLVVANLGKLPVPIELYGFISYAAGIVAVCWALWPLVWGGVITGVRV